MKKRTRAYWKKRFREIEEAEHRKGAETYANIEEQFRKAEAAIERKIEMWYARFAENNEISYAEAKRWLNKKELAELKWDVNEYIKHGEENALSGEWTKELVNASSRAHISRLEALKLQLQQEAEVLYGNELDEIDTMARDVYKDTFYRSAFAIQQGFEIGWDLASIDPRLISKVINKPWAADGKDFSERIWGNRKQLVENMNTIITQNIIRGEDPQKAIDAIAKKMNTSKQNAGRLVMTEEAAFSSAARQDCFKDLGVKQFEIVATLDSHTSELCRDMDGKVFKMSDYEVGVTAPPFHVYCRSTTVPYFEDDFGEAGERAARDEATGKTYYVPADMTYREWQKKFVNGGGKSGLKEAENGGTMNDMSYRKKDPENEGVFETFSLKKDPVIKPRTIMKELNQSEVGRKALEYLENEGVSVYLFSGVDNEKNLYGYYDSVYDEIGIYCDKCKDRVEIAKTVIHEAMHRKLGSTQTFEEEVKCFSEEYLHDHDKLTDEALDSIMERVRRSYTY